MPKKVWNRKHGTISSTGSIKGAVPILYTNRGKQTRDMKILDLKTFGTYNFKYRKFNKANRKNLGLK